MRTHRTLGILVLTVLALSACQRGPGAAAPLTEADRNSIHAFVANFDKGVLAAKAALETLVRYFAVALAQRGITVNSVSPGWTEDSVLNSLPPAAQTAIRDWHTQGWTPMRRLGTPEDIGNVVALLCSEEAGWITGQLIVADGGASLMNSEVPPALQLG